MLDDSKLGAAISYLSSRCDGGQRPDGQGFSGRDVEIGHGLARWWRNKGSFTDKQRVIVLRIVRRYKKQLLKSGHMTEEDYADEGVQASRPAPRSTDS
jgi:hypothetical protein